MENFFTDNPDIQWHFNHLDHQEVVAAIEDNYTQASQHDDAPVSYEDAVVGYRSVLEMAGAIAAKEIAPLAAEVDREGAHFENGQVAYAKGTQRAMDVLAKSNLLGFTLPRRYSGLNFPGLLYSMAIEMVSQADASLMNLFGLQDIAETLHEFGDDTLKDRYLPQFATGKVTGAMILTEPDAGSDLQAVRLKAVLQPDGSWKLYGVKRFITNGCADVSLVLARSEEGSIDGRGLSMFVCEKGPDLVIRRIEHKLGIHGSPTCELQFNGVPAQLVGQRRLGLIRYVMSLMNGARIGVACQGIGIAQAAYEEALKYARKRIQFKHPIVEFPQVYDMLARMKSRIQIARAITYEASRLVDLRRVLEVREAAGDLSVRARLKEVSSCASVLTPIAKAYASEMAIEVTYDAIQIHGGTGYMQEFSVERLASSVMFLKSMNDRTYSELVSRRLVDLASDSLGAHLLLLQAEKDAGRTPLAAKVFADVMPRIRMQADYIASGDKLVIEQCAALL